MTDNNLKVQNDMVVEIAYVLKVDGEVVDESGEESPLAYLHGHDNIIPGLEQALEGRSVGERFNVTVSPAEGYGERSEENIHSLSVDDFEDDIEVGETYFEETEEGMILPFVVTGLDGDRVTVDFNPPLAGSELHFDVTVMGVREATDDEMEFGAPDDGEE